MISAIAAKQQRDMAPVQSDAISRFILLSGPVHAPAQTRPGASGRVVSRVMRKIIFTVW